MIGDGRKQVILLITAIVGAIISGSICITLTPENVRGFIGCGLMLAAVYGIYRGAKSESYGIRAVCLPLISLLFLGGIILSIGLMEHDGFSFIGIFMCVGMSVLFLLSLWKVWRLWKITPAEWQKKSAKEIADEDAWLS